jgi:hypothetical protein
MPPKRQRERTELVQYSTNRGTPPRCNFCVMVLLYLSLIVVVRGEGSVIHLHMAITTCLIGGGLYKNSFRDRNSAAYQLESERRLMKQMGKILLDLECERLLFL